MLRGGGTPGGGAPPLSNTVLYFIQGSLTLLYTKLQKNTATGRDVQDAVTALGVLLGNMQETGYNAWLNQNILANAEQFESNPISQSQIQQIVNDTASRTNIEFSPTEAESLFDLNQDQRVSFIQQIQSVGITGVEGNIYGELQAAANSLGNGTVSFDTSSAPQHPRLLEVNCAATGAAAALLSALSPPPMDVIFAIIAAICGLLAAFHLC